jgi:shikimate kinase
MSKSDNVFLVGPMGAGKSTIGRLLAAELRLPFKDSDEEIERRCGADIAWIFDREGEQGFRDRESIMLRELAQRRGIVLATGGGAVERSQNRQLLAQCGLVVYLHTTVDRQCERTLRDRKRPLLQTEDPRLILEQLMARRDPLYRDTADLVVSTDTRNARSLVHELVVKIQAATASS